MKILSGPRHRWNRYRGFLADTARAVANLQTPWIDLNETRSRRKPLPLIVKDLGTPVLTPTKLEPINFADSRSQHGELNSLISGSRRWVIAGVIGGYIRYYRLIW